MGRISAAWDCGGIGRAVELGLAVAGACFSVGTAGSVWGTLTVGMAFSRVAVATLLAVATLAVSVDFFPTGCIDWQEFKARARLKRMAKHRNRFILFFLSCTPPLYRVVKERISATISSNYNLVFFYP
jgi:hypothetical protein